MFILSYSISFVCFWFSASSLFGIQEQHTQSPVKSSTPSSQEDVRFSGRFTLAYNFHFTLGNPSLAFSNSSLTLHSRAQLLLSRRCPFFRVCTLAYNFTSPFIISLWDSARAYSHSGKALIPSSLKELCFSELIAV